MGLGSMALPSPSANLWRAANESLTAISSALRTVCALPFPKRQEARFNVTDKVKKILIGLAALAALALGGSALAGAASQGKDTPAQERSEPAEGPERGEAAERDAAENSAADPDDVQDENGNDDANERSEKGQDEQSDEPVTGAAASRAKKAAAAETGGMPRRVERDNEKGATYEVEVTLAGGKQVDVRLDDQFNVVSVDRDDEQDEAGEHNETGEHDEAGEPGAATP